MQNDKVRSISGDYFDKACQCKSVKVFRRNDSSNDRSCSSKNVGSFGIKGRFKSGICACKSVKYRFIRGTRVCKK